MEASSVSFSPPKRGEGRDEGISPQIRRVLRFPRFSGQRWGRCPPLWITPPSFRILNSWNASFNLCKHESFGGRINIDRRPTADHSLCPSIDPGCKRPASLDSPYIWLHAKGL